MINTLEVAPEVYQISVFVPEIKLQFNHFLIKDDEPMLYHTGMKQMFPLLLEAVSKIIVPSQIRWFGFSHADGYKYKEIADKLNLNIGTVKSRIFQSRRKLMDQLNR